MCGLILKPKYVTNFFIIALVFLSQILYSQDVSLDVSVPTSGEDRFGVCDQPKVASFEIENISGSSLTSMSMTLTLPAGMNYVPGSVSVISGSGITENVPASAIFNIGDFSAGEVKSFDIQLDVDCDGVSLATGAATTTFDIDFSYTGGGSSQSEITSPFEVVKPSLSIPSIDGVSVFDNPVLDASLELVDTMDIAIVNGGQGKLSSFDFYLVDHNELTLEKIFIDGVGDLTPSYTVGDTTFYTLDLDDIQTAIPGVGSPTNDSTYFQFNESIILKEVWRVTSCNLSAEDIFRGVQYGCNGVQACEQHHNSSGVRFGFERPDLEVSLYEWGDLYPLCYAEETQDAGYYLINTGDIPANNVQFFVWGGTYSSVDTSSVEFSFSANGPFFSFSPDSLTVSSFSAQTQLCLQDAGDSDLIQGARYTLDSLLNPDDTLFIRFEVYNGSDCSAECYINGIYGNALEYIAYMDPCELTTYTEASLNFDARDVQFGNFGEGPIEAYNGILNTNYYTVDEDLDNFFYLSPISCTDCYLEARYIFSNGLDWTGTNGDITTNEFFWVDKQGDRWEPDYLRYVDTNSSEDTLIVRWIGRNPGNFRADNSSFMVLNYEGDCSESPCGKQANYIVDEWYFITDSTCADYGAGSLIDCPDTLSVNLNCSCPGTPCLGLRIETFTTERTNYGFGDNNNNTVPESGETIDTSLIRTNRFIPSDTIEATLSGTVFTDATFTSWDYAFASVELTSTNFIPLAGEVTIYESGGGTYSCELINQFADSNLLISDISPASLISLGCSSLPTGFTYEQDDSVTVTARYVVSDDPGSDLVDVLFQGSLLTSTTPYGGTTYSCDVLRARMYQVGFNILNSGWGLGANFEGCEVAKIHPMFSFLIGTNPFFFRNLDYFPFEVRSFGTLDQIKSYPNNDSTEGRINNLAMIDSFQVVLRPSISGSPRYEFFLKSSSSYLTLIEDSVIFDAPTWFSDNGVSPYFDQGYTGIRLVPFMKATSATNAGERQSVSTEIQWDVNANAFNTSSITWENTWSALYTGGPELYLEVASNNEQLTQRDHCFTFDIVNGGITTAEHVWFSVQNESGGIIINSLAETTPSTTPYQDSLGIFQLGDISSGATHSFELCVNVNNCEIDSLILVTGWDCEEYPITLEESTRADEDTVYFELITSELGMIIREPTVADTSDLCDSVVYELELSSSQLGYLNNIHLQFDLPESVSYNSGSFQLQYPIGGVWDTIADPTNINGNTYEINLSEQNAILDSVGLVGTTDIGQNLFLVRFSTTTGCGYASGSTVSFLSWAFNACGELANFRTSNAEPVYISGSPSVLISNISTTSDTINPCSTNNTSMDIMVTLANTSSAVGPTDSLRILLPLGVSYASGTYVPGMNAVSSAPRIETNNNQEYLYLDLVDGTAPGDTITFSIDIDAADVAQECRSYEMELEVFHSFSATCQLTGSSCDARAISDSETADIYFEKADLSILTFEADAFALPPDAEDLEYELSYTNTGEDISGSENVIIEIYNDTDEDGIYSATDELLGSIVSSGGVVQGDTVTESGSISIDAGKSCYLLAVIRPENTCMCSQTSSFQIRPQLDATFTRDISVCYEESTSIGPTPMDGFSYQWISFNGSDTTKISNTLQTPTTFESTNETGQDISWTYLLRTIRGSCYAYDTLNVTVYSRQFAQVTNTTCSLTPTQLAGPSNGTNYVWSPATNLSDPTSFNTAVSSVPNTITYALTYTDENGCNASFAQTLQPVSCANSGITGLVWEDDNTNGIRDSGEPALDSVTVVLYSQANLSTPMLSTFTDASGAFSFNPLPAGTYSIAFFTESTGRSFILTLADQGTSDSLDSDVNPLSGLVQSIYVANGSVVSNVGAGFVPFIGGLPVSFFNFGVQIQENDALLNWITASELNNDVFVIERSSDGLAYFGVGQVRGAGTTRKFQEYSYRDQDIIEKFSDQVFYRLKQIDFDGAFTYSDIVILSLEEETVVTIFPNPAKDLLFIRYLIPRDDTLKVSVSDQVGKELYVEEFEGGSNQQVEGIDIRNWAKGLYYFNINTEEGHKTYKVIIQ